MVALLAFATVLLPALSASAVETAYFTANGAQEAVLSEMAIHPSALRVGSVTYLAYQGPGYDPYVAAYDESTREWSGPVRVGENPLQLDAHGAPSLFTDATGRLHVLYGSHFTAMKHAVAARPDSIASWVDLSPPSTNATYPQPIRLPDGKLLLFFRQGGSDYFGWVFRVSRDDGITWDDGFATVLAGGSYGWYAHFAEGAGGIVHCAFTRYEPNSSGTYLGRRDLYYIWRDRFGTWRNIRGDAVTIPVTRATADAECGVYSSGSDVVNEVVVKDDPSRNVTPAPLIEFVTGSGRGTDAYRWAFAHAWGGSWSVHTITRTDHSFDAATFDPHPDGSIDSYLVSGRSDSLDNRLDPFEGRGGGIERWASDDRGETWTFAAHVSPDETGTLYSDPHLVEGAGGSPRLLFTEWTNDRTSFFQRLYLWADGSLLGRSTPPKVERAAGVDRVGTAIAASRVAFPERADAVLLATSRDYPDALSAAPLAAALHGPVLLVPRDHLPASVAEEIRRLSPSRAIVLGSSRVIDVPMEKEVLASAGVADVERIAGPDRYATALGIARRLRATVGPLRTAVVVSGRNFPDALSAAPYAAWARFPILLANGSAPSQATLTALGDLDVTSTIVVGGPSAVATSYASQLPSPVVIAGADRYETSALVARFALANGLLPDRLVFASGLGYADALSGGVLAARARAPMLLVGRDNVPGPIRDLVSEIGTRTVQVWVMGGTPAVSNAVPQDVAGILGGP